MSPLSLFYDLGTLALGINAPTKTCVFVGDSPFLTASTVSAPRFHVCGRLTELISIDNAVVVPADAVTIYWEMCSSMGWL